jgi:hypothetical protein
MSDKSKSDYYGGYALHRSTNPSRASAAAQSTHVQQPFVPSMGLGFHSDWMMSGMMAALPPAVAVKPQPVVSVKLPVPPERSVAMAAAPPTQVPQAAPAFWNNFLLGQSNFYRGAPVHNAPAKSSPPVLTTAPTAAVAATGSRAAKPPVPQFSGMWHAFDAPIGFSKAPQSSHVDPIGSSTQHTKSLWSGTPVCSTREEDEKWYNPFSLITPPVFKVVTKAPSSNPRMLASIDASSSDDEESGVDVKLPPKPTAFKGDEINSDDDDWLDHLRDTVTQVLHSFDEEQPQEQLFHEGSDGAVHDAFTRKKLQQDFDPDWSKLRAV